MTLFKNHLIFLLSFSIAAAPQLAIAADACEGLRLASADHIAFTNEFDRRRVIFSDAFDPKALETLTLELIRQVGEKKERRQDSITGWLTSIELSQQQHPLNVMEHTALLYILRAGIFDEPESTDAKAVLIRCIEISYSHLAERPVTGEAALKSLPNRVVAAASIKEQIFHEGVFVEIKQQKNIANTTPRRTRFLPKVGQHINIVNVATVLLTAAALTTDPGRMAFAGAMIGLTQASINEYLVHLGIGHAPETMLKLFTRMGGLGKKLERIQLSHKLHHALVGRYYGVTTLPPEMKERAERIMRAMVETMVLNQHLRADKNLTEADSESIRGSESYKNDVEQNIEMIRNDNYGVNASVEASASMLVTSSPFMIMNLAVFAATGDVTLLVSSMSSLIFWVIHSLYSHRYMHIRPQDQPTTKTTRFMAWYSKTALGRWQNRIHLMHHESPYAFKYSENGVIMAFSVADYLFQRGVVVPNILNLLEMERQGFLDAVPQTDY